MVLQLGVDVAVTIVPVTEQSIVVVQIAVTVDVAVVRLTAIKA